jgi:N-acetylmuramoyl-L-alanine amidase
MKFDKFLQNKKNWAKSFFCCMLSLVFVLSSSSSAFANEQQTAYDRSAFFVDVGGCSASSGSSDTVSASTGKTVVIDPGHGPNKTTVDDKTGLSMVESDNQPEGHDVWEVSNKIKKDLSGQGYNIILTKKTEDDNVTFRERANIADDNQAVLALSIHGDPGLPDSGEIFVQKVGLYRGSGSNKTVFNDDDVAKKSQEYAKVFKQQREKSEGGSVVIKDNSFNGRAGLEPGNIPMVQLFSKTPWVYNEKKMSFNKDKYAEGLENAIKKVVEGGATATTGASGGCCSGSGISANGSVSPQVGFGMSADAQEKFQQIVVAAGGKFDVDPNYVATFYYTEMGRTGDSTNNADAASGTPVTGDGKWVEPAPPEGQGDKYIQNSSGYWEPYGLGDGASGSFDTMAAYGKDGDGDGKIEPDNLADAAFTAANLLAQDGAKTGANQQKLHDVALLYNHAETYAQSVVNTYNYLTGKGGKDVSGSTGSCDSAPITGDGSVQSAVEAAKKLSDYKIPYSQACRTMKKVPPSCGYDCSASVSWVLLTAGFKLPRDVTWGGWAPVSGDYTSWGKAGEGKQMTVWANDGHVFIEFNVPGLGHYQLNTAGWDGSGPHFFKWGYPTSGFTPRHWPGT